MLFFVFFLSPFLPVHLPPSTDVECGVSSYKRGDKCAWDAASWGMSPWMWHLSKCLVLQQMWECRWGWRGAGMKIVNTCTFVQFIPPPPPPNSISLWSNTLDHSEIPVHFNVSKVLFSFQKWCSSGWTCIMAALKCSPECEYSPCWPQQKMQCAVSDHTVVLLMFFFYMLYHNELDV